MTLATCAIHGTAVPCYVCSSIASFTPTEQRVHDWLGGKVTVNTDWVWHNDVRKLLAEMAEQRRQCAELQELLRQVLRATTAANWIGLGSPLEAAINEAITEIAGQQANSHLSRNGAGE